MKRTELVAALKIAGQGLASREVMPIYSCFCFGNKVVSASNDAVGVQTPCDVDFRGAVQGGPLMHWLTNSRAREVLFGATDNGEVLLRAGRSKMKCGVLPTEDFVFRLERSKQAQTLPVDEPLLEAIRKVSIGMLPAGQGDVQWTTGLTLVAKGKKLTLYSGGNHLICQAEVKLKSTTSISANLRYELVQLLLSMKKQEPERLVIADDWSRVEFSDGTSIQAANLAEPRPGDYEAILSELPEYQPVPNPKGFAQAVERALGVLSEAEPGTRYKVQDGKLIMTSSSPLGIVRDRLPFSDEHPELETKSPTHLLKPVLPYASSVAFGSQCVYLFGEGFFAVVSSIEEIVEEMGGDDDETEEE